MDKNDYYLHAFSHGPIRGDLLWIDEMLPKLLSILEFGLLSRSLLNEKGISVYLGPPNWNDSNYVSVTHIGHSSDLITKTNNDFWEFSYNCPALLISKEIEDYLEFRTNGKKMLNEEHIKDIITPEFICGLRLPFVFQLANPYFSSSEIMEIKAQHIYQIINNNGYDIPIYAEEDLRKIPKTLNYKKIS